MLMLNLSPSDAAAMCVLNPLPSSLSSFVNAGFARSKGNSHCDTFLDQARYDLSLCDATIQGQHLKSKVQFW